MKIRETALNFKNKLKKRDTTEWLILHHAYASKCDAKTIHGWHLANGWSGFGYHFLVRKDGVIERGRPIEMIGSHCKGHNHYSVGVCFEGNFETETMSDVQIQAGQELVQMIKDLYPDINICRHKDAWGQDTKCPGVKFPFDKLLESPVKESKSEIIKQIKDLLDKLV